LHLIYIDDSRDKEICAFSALAVPAEQWRDAFQQVREWRRALKRDYGIYVHKELHAWKFVSGRGGISSTIVTKWQRCRIFHQALELTARLPGVGLFNACFPVKQDERAFERMVNRINRTLQSWDSRGILICDEGKEAAYTRLVRRMGVYNPIPSAFGTWTDTGEAIKNIPIERILEDPFFKKSERSYFIQLVDMAVYALLRREHPVPSKTRYGLHKAFEALTPILVKVAAPRDPDGIIRP
jgi:hypothetical protein